MVWGFRKAQEKKEIPQEYTNADTSELGNAPQRGVSSRKAKRFFDQQTVQERAMANSFRPHFYFWAIRWARVAILASFVSLGVYTVSNWGHLDARVFATFLGATVVEVIGIVAIIARYLFQTSVPKNNSRNDPEE